MAAKSLLPLLVATIVGSALAQSPVDWQPLLDQQNLVLRQVVQTLHLTRGGPVGPEETDACFDWYLNNQTAINEVYYKEYNECINTATAAKKLLSAQSALERNDLLDYGHSLCSALSACESIVDGLRFFQCYNKAVSICVNESRLCYLKKIKTFVLVNCLNKKSLTKQRNITIM